jgi:hypothetical protein
MAYLRFKLLLTHAWLPPSGTKDQLSLCNHCAVFLPLCPYIYLYIHFCLYIYLYIHFCFYIYLHIYTFADKNIFFTFLVAHSNNATFNSNRILDTVTKGKKIQPKCLFSQSVLFFAYLNYRPFIISIDIKLIRFNCIILCLINYLI